MHTLLKYVPWNLKEICWPLYHKRDIRLYEIPNFLRSKWKIYPRVLVLSEYFPETCGYKKKIPSDAGLCIVHDLMSTL